MPGSIKIDDGSGNYTILTNAGSLGSDKTLTIPNETATLATTNGITGADTYRMTSDLTSTTTPITNWERPDGTLQSTAFIGSGMSVSSGLFTFPATGIWRVDATAYAEIDSSGGIVEFSIKATDDNFSSEAIVQIARFAANDNFEDGIAGGSTLLDIEDTANDKVKFELGTSGTVKLRGDSSINRTHITFTRLGDT